jgi:CBS domain containing-hemolysin-like protein
VSPKVSIGAQVALLGFLILCSAYFSSAETAITSLGEGRLRYLINTHRRKQKALSALLKGANDQITALLLLNNLVNIGASSLMTLIFLRLLPAGMPDYEAGLMATGVMTVSLLILAEITPKNFAKNNAERYTLAIINQIYLLTWLLRPFIFVFRGIADAIMRLFGEELSRKEPFAVSDEQIETLIDASEKRGLMDIRDGEMIRRILEFDQMSAEQVMVPRTEVKGIEINTPLEEAKAIMAKDGHSRFPVYNNVPDNIIGALYAKDMLSHCDDSTQGSLRTMLRPVYYTPASKPINILLREFQRERVHMAVVLDEFGGMAGIVTMEDILEEIVGEIEDEYDQPVTLIKRISSDEVLANGETALHQLSRTLNIELPDDDSVTVNGLLLNLRGEVPQVGEEVPFGPVKFTVKGATEREVTSVQIQVDRSAKWESEEEENNQL